MHPHNPAEPRRTLGDIPAEANFLGEPLGGLCPSDSDPPELLNYRVGKIAYDGRGQTIGLARGRCVHLALREAWHNP